MARTRAQNDSNKQSLEAICMYLLAKILAPAFLLCMTLHQTIVAEPPGLELRQQSWREELDRRKFGWPDGYCGLVMSLSRFTADAQIHIVFDPVKKRTLKFNFVRNGREILSLSGHLHSAFTSFGNTLYFADYPLGSTGCTVSAYDLATGKQIWETELHHSKPMGHSAYANFVMMRMSNAGEIKDEEAGAAIIITGKESYCDYVEVLDSQTGESLAVKNYRKGFGPPPPAGGGFDGKDYGAERR